MHFWCVLTFVINLIHTQIPAESLVFPPYLHTYGIRKAVPAHLFMFFGTRTFFNDPQGLATARLDSWENPKEKKDDDEVVVYGVNAGRGEIIYNTSMYSLGLYGEKGSGRDQFLHPRGIAADAKGNVFVADSGNNRIVKLFNPKSSLIWKKTFNGASKSDKGLAGPSRVTIDEKINVYANDPGNRRIVVFDSAGTILRTIPQSGKGVLFADGPTALAIADGSARWSYGRDEQALFCADKNGSRVWKLGFDGRLLAQVHMPSGHVACYGATDYHHNYYVTDRKNHCVVKFDHNLKLLDIFGSYGDKDNQFNDPRGITIYKRFGQAFIAEKKGAQYFWIGTDLKKSTLVKKGEGKYFLTVQVTEFTLLTLFSAVQKDTVTYFKRRWVPCGLSSFEFTVDQAGGIREQGLTLKTEPTYSSFTYSAWYRPMRVTK